VTATPPPGGSSPRPPATDSGELFRDAVRYWEVRRIWYNLILLGIAVAWVVATWPHFRPAMSVASLLKVLVLALLANLCYSAAYLVDIPLQQSGARAAWRRRRWALWLAGMLFAVVFANYWIADEIYPFVN
jgi:hypothetical protein